MEGHLLWLVGLKKDKKETEIKTLEHKRQKTDTLVTAARVRKSSDGEDIYIKKGEEDLGGLSYPKNPYPKIFILKWPPSVLACSGITFRLAKGDPV